MYNNEFKNELKNINSSIKNIDDEFINIKIAIHNLEKLGLDTKELKNLLDNVGIEFYKLKMYSNDYTKEKIKNQVQKSVYN